MRPEKLSFGGCALFLAVSLSLPSACQRSEEEASEAPSDAPTEAPLGRYEHPALPDPPADPADPRFRLPRGTPELEGEDDPRIGQLMDLGSEDDPQGVAKVMALAFAEPVLPAVQYEALSALEDLREVNREGAVEGAGRILKRSENLDVKLRAVEALEYLETRRATEILIEALGDPDAGVREAICEVIAYTAQAQDLEPVKAAYEAESDRQVKTALWEVLENIAVELKQEEKKGTS